MFDSSIDYVPICKVLVNVVFEFWAWENGSPLSSLPTPCWPIGAADGGSGTVCQAHPAWQWQPSQTIFVTAAHTQRKYNSFLASVLLHCHLAAHSLSASLGHFWNSDSQMMKHYVRLDISLDQMPINRILRLIDFELKTTESFNVRPLASRATPRMLSSVLQRGGGGGSAPLARPGQLSLLLLPRREQSCHVLRCAPARSVSTRLSRSITAFCWITPVFVCAFGSSVLSLLCDYFVSQWDTVPSLSLQVDTERTVPY